MLAGALAAAGERVLGRHRLLWAGAVLLAAGAVGLTAGRTVEQTIAATLLMGIGGGVVLTTAQATLADHHGSLRTVALTEANVAASGAYLVLIAMFSVSAALEAGWRAAILASLVVPAWLWWRARATPLAVPGSSQADRGRLPGAFWVAATVLLCTTAAEWCITAWGASFAEDVLDVSTDTAVSLMAGYFGGVLVGRVVGSRLARRFDPARLLGWALAVAAVGFFVTWPSVAPPQALVGLALLGIGLGNLFPLGMSLAVALVPTRAASASGRAVAMSSLAVLLAPLMVATLADATSLKDALAVVPVLLALAAAGLVVVRRQARRPEAHAVPRRAEQRRG
jgi:fucose permease